jgi:hypothetical protein
MRRTLPPDVEPFPGAQDDTACAGTARRCAWKGCCAAGEYRAPKDRTLREHYFFCLAHVRAYNAQWDFHHGLTAAEMEAELRSASTWGRPTWKLGSLGATARAGRMPPGWSDPPLRDPLDLGAGTGFDRSRRARAAGERRRQRAPGAVAEERRALRILELAHPVTLDVLQRRYKALAKRHHPDANGGSPEAETRMKLINAAYCTLRTLLGAPA